MAYTTIDPNSIEVGDALRAELFTLIKTNLDDLDARVNLVSLGAAKIDVFNFQLLNGSNFSIAKNHYFRHNSTCGHFSYI